MRDYKRIILYIAFAIVAVALWHAWQKDYSLPKQHTSSYSSQSKLSNHGNSSAKAIPKSRIVNVKTDVLAVKIDSLGGSIISANFCHYPLTLHAKKTFQLLNYYANSHYTAQSSLTGFVNRPLQYHVAKKYYLLHKGQKQLVVVLKATTYNKLQITKTFTFYPNSYLIDIGHRITNHSNKTKKGQLVLQISRSSVKPPSDGTFRIHSFYGFALSTPQTHYQTYSFSKLNEIAVNKRASHGWFAMVQHYFLTAWIPNIDSNYHYYSNVGSNGIYTLGAKGPLITVAPHKTVNLSDKFYVGPKITNRLNSVAPHLAMTIDYGWLWPISIVIFWLMSHIHHFIGNWGWSIVIVTAIIKLIFWKLSSSSYRSMAGMRALQPKITALKESCGEDRQRFGREMMTLYKREKVNPLGGCLPIIIQIPFFIALYWVLIATVELRQAPFIFWIHDLAAKDPYYVLPVLMGLTMLLQQKLSPPPPDPTQAKIMMFLPLFITAIFVNFPSGLILYMLVNNILSIAQQWWITDHYDKGKFYNKSQAWQRHKKAKRKK